MAPKTEILFLGATGYLGAGVLTRLLNHPKASEFSITTLVRSTEKGEALKKYNPTLKYAVGSLFDKADYPVIENLGKNADIVFSIADADYLPWTVALLKGLKARFDATGVAPILIHTSGTGILLFTSDPAGNHSDLDLADVKAVPPTALHRNVDLAAIGADEAGYVKTYLVCPPLIAGLASGPLYDAGLAHRNSIQAPALMRPALDRKQAGVVGDGKGVWAAVHVDDVADAFILLFNKIIAGAQGVGHGWEGYYYLENGELSWNAIAGAIGKALVELGVGKSPEVTSFTADEITKYYKSEFASSVVSSTCRAKGERARALGWSPKYGVADMLAGLKPELEFFLKKAQAEGKVDLTPNHGVDAMLQRFVSLSQA
ncbi:uncharacterized protein C8Q71DRAFT_858030 [Rhodofomes roseus]|uniref:Semialdehyde dehydrogenase NAD-binding domain-containing protein n=1 Tax=Rhodofomes roseus TaxID=34475 RepID=A0ABQ8KGC3_9APHY|nr:uncharacterized protein C8Q71DRAFT_858030 [Rhodofomes roseus]KAH9836833.1 hypothetical protein C8Q71DRAFT_858030 [Rhodofomes roseus]